MARAKSGERHSIHSKETSRGTTWYATVDIGKDPATGKRRQKRLTAPTRKALDVKIAEIVGKLNRGENVVESRLTVGELLDEWLVAIAPTIKPTTLRRYKECSDRELKPALGAIRLAKLSPLDVQRMETAALARKLSPTTVYHIHYVLRRALHQALRWGYVTRNVCDAVDPPRRAQTEMQAWTVEQAAKVLAKTQGDDLEALWRLAITTGMRRGELLGLRWQDVDFDRGALAIRHTLVRGAKGQWESSTPKTLRSRRSIALSADDLTVLRHHEDRQKLKRHAGPNHYVFTSDDGGPVHATTLQRRFTALIAAAGVPTIRFHDLRHTAATLMLTAGEHPKIVSERLGHSTIAMTLDRYSHVTESMQQAAADRLAKLLSDAS